MQTGEPFGRLVKELRKALDLTQENLANKVGCAVITIARIEGETLRPSKQMAERLAAALEVPIEERAAFVRRARSTRLLARAERRIPRDTLYAW